MLWSNFSLYNMKSSRNAIFLSVSIVDEEYEDFKSVLLPPPPPSDISSLSIHHASGSLPADISKSSIGLPLVVPINPAQLQTQPRVDPSLSSTVPRPGCLLDDFESESISAQKSELNELQFFMNQPTSRPIVFPGTAASTIPSSSTVVLDGPADTLYPSRSVSKTTSSVSLQFHPIHPSSRRFIVISFL